MISVELEIITMPHASEAIPISAVATADAYQLLFHVKFPHWRDRMSKPDCFRDAADFAERDRDERVVTDRLWDGYCDGTIPLYVRDVSGEILRLPRGEGKIPWFKHAFSDDVFASSPLDRAGRDDLPVFMMRA